MSQSEKAVRAILREELTIIAEMTCGPRAAIAYHTKSIVLEADAEAKAHGFLPEPDWSKPVRQNAATGAWENA